MMPERPLEKRHPERIAQAGKARGVGRVYPEPRQVYVSTLNNRSNA